MADIGESVTIPIEISPPKYQATIPKKARAVLDCEDETVLLEATLTVKRVTEERDH